MAGWAWGPSEKTGRLGSGPQWAPAPPPLPAPSVSVSGRSPRRRGPCPGPLTRPGCVGGASGAGRVGEACVWERPARGRGLRGGARGRGLWGGAEGCSAQALLCAHRCRRPVKGVAPSLHRGPWSACDGRSLNLRPSTPPWEGPEASPGSGAALQCSPGDTLPGPRGFHHNCLAGG